MAGIRWADPFRQLGGDFSSEYTRITNRTYNGQGGPWEKWLHRNKPIAHFLGNDFERWLTTFSWWPHPVWRLMVVFDMRRCGEGRIENEFDTPWMDTPLGDDYSEPFPTGVVGKSSRYALELSYQPCIALQAFARAGYWDVRNVDHQAGAKFGEWRGSLGVEFSFFHKLKIE